MKECLEDCCEVGYPLLCRLNPSYVLHQACPEPQNEEEHKLQDEQDRVYIRGRISRVTLLICITQLNHSWL